MFMDEDEKTIQTWAPSLKPQKAQLAPIAEVDSFIPEKPRPAPIASETSRIPGEINQQIRDPQVDSMKSAAEFEKESGAYKPEEIAIQLPEPKTPERTAEERAEVVNGLKQGLLPAQAAEQTDEESTDVPGQYQSSNMTISERFKLLRGVREGGKMKYPERKILAEQTLRMRRGTATADDYAAVARAMDKAGFTKEVERTGYNSQTHEEVTYKKTRYNQGGREAQSAGNQFLDRVSDGAINQIRGDVEDGDFETSKELYDYIETKTGMPGEIVIGAMQSEEIQNAKDQEVNPTGLAEYPAVNLMKEIQRKEALQAGIDAKISQTKGELGARTTYGTAAVPSSQRSDLVRYMRQTGRDIMNEADVNSFIKESADGTTEDAEPSDELAAFNAEGTSYRYEGDMTRLSRNVMEDMPDGGYTPDEYRAKLISAVHEEHKGMPRAVAESVIVPKVDKLVQQYSDSVNADSLREFGASAIRAGTGLKSLASSGDLAVNNRVFNKDTNKANTVFNFAANTALEYGGTDFEAEVALAALGHSTDQRAIDFNRDATTLYDEAVNKRAIAEYKLDRKSSNAMQQKTVRAAAFKSDGTENIEQQSLLRGSSYNENTGTSENPNFSPFVGTSENQEWLNKLRSQPGSEYLTKLYNDAISIGENKTPMTIIYGGETDKTRVDAINADSVRKYVNDRNDLQRQEIPGDENTWESLGTENNDLAYRTSSPVSQAIGQPEDHMTSTYTPVGRDKIDKNGSLTQFSRDVVKSIADGKVDNVDALEGAFITMLGVKDKEAEAAKIVFNRMVFGDGPDARTFRATLLQQGNPNVELINRGRDSLVGAYRANTLVAAIRRSNTSVEDLTRSLMTQAAKSSTRYSEDDGFSQRLTWEEQIEYGITESDNPDGILRVYSAYVNTELKLATRARDRLATSGIRSDPDLDKNIAELEQMSTGIKKAQAYMISGWAERLSADGSPRPIGLGFEEHENTRHVSFRTPGFESGMGDPMTYDEWVNDENQAEVLRAHQYNNSGMRDEMSYNEWLKDSENQFGGGD